MQATSLPLVRASWFAIEKGNDVGSAGVRSEGAGIA